MEAPEKIPDKIYLYPSRIRKGTIQNCWFRTQYNQDSIGFFRSDVFIEKALKWYCLDCECNDNCDADHKCFFRQEYKRYLEGNDNALPPKIGNAFKPDDDFIDNRIHKHLIRKMQDAFIEKACNYWYKHNQEMVKRYGSKAILGCSEFTVNVKNFQEYMKGE